MDEIMQTILANIEEGKKPQLSEVPKKGRGRPRKKMAFVGPKRKAIKLLVCPKIHTLVKWWCKTSHQYMATFIQKAITDAFVREIQEREATVKLMEKFYNEYFDEPEPDTPVGKTIDHREI